ncbi:hypothetical protein EUX98_g4488 [Antrodiella citrinella]|uniref:MYND-type domain-containing protein n=1 Tax=Antrodiella citrinella TaxID=2447956 RepID=A0A4S4MVU2_9APHY|nr:hypothetical protein EUX98_g4488 [Antrodiella citrinella]
MNFAFLSDKHLHTLEKNEDSAMAWWMQIAFETSPETNAPIPRGIRVRALSCLANSQWELKVTEDDPDTWNIDSVHRAGVFADDCAALGFVSAIMLHIGMKIRELRALPHVPEARHPRFTKLEYLWEIVETRNQEMAREKQKRDQTVVKAPNAYVCALKGCGIEGTRKSALLRCAGKCPADVKPSYCSKECQKADWKKHKLICKPNAAAKDKPHVADAPAAKTKMTIGESIRTDGKEVRIEMPDIIGGSGTIPLVSKTMTPEFMKDVRDEVEKLLVTDADKRSEAN